MTFPFLYPDPETWSNKLKIKSSLGTLRKHPALNNQIFRASFIFLLLHFSLLHSYLLSPILNISAVIIFNLKLNMELNLWNVAFQFRNVCLSIHVLGFVVICSFFRPRGGKGMETPCCVFWPPSFIRTYQYYFYYVSETCTM